MRIAHIVCTYPPYKGGMGNSAKGMIAALMPTHDAQALTPFYQTIEQGEKNAHYLKPLITFGNSAALPQLFWHLKSYDILHLHYPFYGAHLPVLLASVLWKKPLIIHYHMDTESNDWKNMLFKLNRLLVEPFLLAQAKIIIGSSQDYLDYSFIKNFVAKNHTKIRIVPFALKQDFFDNKPDEAKEKTILFVAGLDRAHYFKGLDVLLIALRQIKNNGRLNGFSLKIIGDGDLRSAYQDKAQALGLESEVFFLGKINDQELKKAYQKAAMLVLPSISRGEAFGLVLIEAMASATPVIASDLPGVRSVFIEKAHGLLAKPGDAASLAEALSEMINNETFRQNAGQQARLFALNNYSQVGMAEKLNDIYQEVSV
jgi:glycosyltransferase involved in cell wall biosynthesis